jgi:hypothetical protein
MQAMTIVIVVIAIIVVILVVSAMRSSSSKTTQSNDITRAQFDFAHKIVQDYLTKPDSVVLQAEVDRIVAMGYTMDNFPEPNSREGKKLANDVIIDRLLEPATVAELTYRMRDELDAQQAKHVIESMAKVYKQRFA